MSKNMRPSKPNTIASEHGTRRTHRKEKEKEKERLENLVPSFIESSHNARPQTKRKSVSETSKVKPVTSRQSVSLDRKISSVVKNSKSTAESSKQNMKPFASPQKSSTKSRTNQESLSSRNVKSTEKKKNTNQEKNVVEKPPTLKTSHTLKVSPTQKVVKTSQQGNSKASTSKKVKKSERKEHNISTKQSERNPIIDSDEVSLRPLTSTLRKGSVILENLMLDGNHSVPQNLDLNAGKDFSSKKQVNSKTSDQGDENESSYEEDFEEYDSDFEDSDENSISEGSHSASDSDSDPQNPIQILELNVKNAEYSSQFENQHKAPDVKISAKIKKPEKTFLKMSDRPSLMSENSGFHSSIDNTSMKMSNSFINFASAVEKEAKEKSTNKVLKRASELLELITLDENSFDLIDIPPMKYDIYIRTFGRCNTKQAFVQSENYDDESFQTDDIDTKDKWTQYPPNDDLGCGGSDNSEDLNKPFSMESLFSTRDVKLTNFLQNASSVVISLLNERYSSFNGKQVTNQRKNMFYSDGFYILSPLIKDIPVINMSCSLEPSHYIISVHDNVFKLPETSAFPVDKGIICVWNIFDSEKPESVLVTNSQPTCACFGPGSNNIVIAGMVDGAVMLWDLTELSSRHSQVQVDNDIVTLRSPTYNTASVLGADNHHSCIVAVKVVNNYLNSYKTGNSDFTKSFHVFTLEDMGVLNIWVVVEILKPDVSGFGSDLGLSPGGKLRLVRSSSIALHSLHTLNQELRTGIRTFDFRIVPADSNRILVTTDVGLILHVARHDGDTEPRFYSGEFEFASEIRCIDCSHHIDNLFLVGCSDGSARLYSTHSVRPLMNFPQVAVGESVTVLQWSTVHPSVFCVLSSSSQLHFWDLMESIQRPVHSYHFTDARVSWFTICSPGRNSSKSSGVSLNLLISKDNGEVEVHVYQQKLNKKEYSQQIEFMKNL